MSRVSLLVRSHTCSLCVAFTPDGRHVASTWDDDTIRVYDVASKKLVRTMQGHINTIRSLAVTSDGLHLVSASYDRTARVWCMESGAEVRTLRHESSLYGVALSPDNQLIITTTGYPDYAVCVWRMADGGLLRQMKGHHSAVCSVAVSPDGLHVVSGSYDETARVWLLADGALQREIKHPGSVPSVAVTPDSQRIVTGCDDGIVRVFLLATGDLVREFKGHMGVVLQVAVSASGRHVVSGSDDKTVRVWSLADARIPLVLTGHASTVYCVAFHPNGKQVASASLDRTVRIWTVCEWSDRDHQLFSAEFKSLVFLLMCCKERIDSESEQATVILPKLPMAVWLDIFKFLQAIYD